MYDFALNYCTKITDQCSLFLKCSFPEEYSLYNKMFAHERNRFGKKKRTENVYI